MLGVGESRSPVVGCLRPPARRARASPVRSFVRCVRRRARTTTGSPPDRKDTPSKGGVVVWESDSRGQRPRSCTRQRRGLGFRSSRSPYLGALKYRVAVLTVPAARPLPHPRVARVRVVVVLRACFCNLLRGALVCDGKRGCDEGRRYGACGGRGCRPARSAVRSAIPTLVPAPMETTIASSW